MLKSQEDKMLFASSSDDCRHWDALVSNAPTPDTYFRPGYVVAYVEEHLSAIALVLQTSRSRFLVPLLLRPLQSLAFAAAAPDYDALTPYGYGGVLPLDVENVSVEDAIELIDALKRWCLENKIVSCMLRLHPLMEQSSNFSLAARDSAGVTLREHGATKAINLLAWDETLKAPIGMNKGRRSDLNFARRELSVTTASCDTPEGIASMKVFREIYNETMQRIGASSYYLFSEEYYLSLMRGLGGKMAVAIAAQGQDAVGGALFFADEQFGHYHLSGTTVEGRQCKANTMVLVAGADWARQRGCSLLHLGGGVTPDDSLFQFKSSFGAATFSYSFMTVIANRPRYDELVKLRHANTEIGPLREGFFPEYRA